MGLWTLMMRLGVSRGAKLRKMVAFGGPIGSPVGASWAPLAGCWTILGCIFVGMFAGMFWGADLAAKLVYLGVDYV